MIVGIILIFQGDSEITEFGEASKSYLYYFYKYRKYVVNPCILSLMYMYLEILVQC